MAIEAPHALLSIGNKGKCIFELHKMSIATAVEEIQHLLIGNLSHYSQGFLHPRWCRIPSINSMFVHKGVFLSVQFQSALISGLPGSMRVMQG